MADFTTGSRVRVLVTGFSPFQTITLNPSWEIVRQLQTSLSSSKHPDIQLTIPDHHIPSVYHELLVLSPKLIEDHNPDIVVHIGLAEGYEWFAAEASAQRGCYHEIPDNARKVFTRAENKKVFGKGPSSLASSLDLEAAVEMWKENVRGILLPEGGRDTSSRNAKNKGLKAKGLKGKQVDVRWSDNVGNYVCGFVYYVSMLEMQRRWCRRDVVFLHVPMLKGDEEIAVGVRVTEELIRAVVETWTR